MNNPIPFQYSLLQYGHDLVTGEWLNVGLALYSSANRYFKASLLLRYQRLTQAFPGADGEFYRRYMTHLQLSLDQLAITVGRNQLTFLQQPDEIGQLLAAVITPDDVSVRFSPARGGLTEDLDATFEELYSRQVEHYAEATPEARRSDDEILTGFRRALRESDLIAKLPPRTIHTPLEDIEFPHAWKNGAWNVIQPVSFDLKRPDTISRKARELIGSAAVLQFSPDVSRLVLILGRPQGGEADLQRAYRKARTTLEGQSDRLPLEVVEEDKTGELVSRIRRDVESHQ